MEILLIVCIVLCIIIACLMFGRRHGETAFKFKNGYMGGRVLDDFDADRKNIDKFSR